jgi:glycosyltransferase involved in cell wall biosynthesis
VGETKSVHTVLTLGARHRFAEFDLYHSPADLVPLALRCPWVVTIHDLMWLEAPRLASAFLPVRMANGIWYTANIRRAIAGAERVIAISDATRDAIVRVFPRWTDKVRVIHHGLDRERYSMATEAPRRLLDDIVPPGQSFSLIVGQGSPYKNHARMVRAFLRAMQGRSDHRLVLVRRFNRVDAEMSQVLATPEAKRLVVAVSHVSDDVLAALYRHARMLLFVSLYEGFGLPALEAMAMGVPVLASTAPAVEEITASGALHANPHDEADIARNIRRLCEDDALRARLIAAGQQRAQDFSWDETARATLEVYREAARSGRAVG